MQGAENMFRRVILLSLTVSLIIGIHTRSKEQELFRYFGLRHTSYHARMLLGYLHSLFVVVRISKRALGRHAGDDHHTYIPETI